MFKRATLSKGTTQKKKKDEHCRKRDIIVNFRMSSKEREELDNRIKLSGMVKQDYMIKSALYQKICVVGNPRVFDEIKIQLEEIQEHMKKAKSWDDVNEVKLVTLKTIAEIVASL